MSKIPTDLTMAWFAHTLQTGMFTDEVWNIITWIAFFFKLASLAFVVPLFGLIAFDFCLWIWRLNQPQPEDGSRSSRFPSTPKEQRIDVAPSKTTSSATGLGTNAAASQRRPIHSTLTDD